MQTISLHAKVGDDGILRLEVPLGTRGEEMDVVVVVQRQNELSQHIITSSHWVDESYGSCADDPVERPEQGEWPVREDWK